MKTLKLSILILAFQFCALAQLTTTQTTLSTAIAANTTTQWCIASATGVVLPGLSSNSSGSILMVDREAVQITSQGSTATCYNVKRGQLGTSASYSHASGARVWVGTAATGSGDNSRPFTGGPFISVIPTGSCTSTLQYTLPVIVTGIQGGASALVAGDPYTCFESMWTRAYGVTYDFTDTTAALGTVRVVRGEAVASNATITGGNLVGVRGAVTVPTGSTVSGGFLYGAQAKLIVVGTVAAGSTVTASISQWDFSSATAITGGANSVHWFDMGTTGTGALTTTNMLRITNTTAATVNSFFTIYGKSTYLAEFSPNGSTWLDTTGFGSGHLGRLLVNFNGTPGYIYVYTN